ncbi:hypothetical protein L6E12_31250 [Actinokineospora sp. PR83]|uniref:hypothetical protein n=1 Tax=Actinokineospora sp. PR83 TaxID=2884908 RepID=UPI001F1DA167|nr:hypothetical protein [Actinokineospora sp. PR83]MCG8920256.1 hypothetical protein [Actinokineospora sp. PR83]
MASFDPKNVTPVEWMGIGAGAAAFIFSFLPWVSISAFFSASAWNSGLLAWLPVLLLVVAAGLLLATHFGTAVKNLPLIWLVLAGVSVLFILLRWVTLSDDDYMGVVSAGAGLFLGLLAAIVSTVGAVLTFKATRGRVA